MPFVLAALGGAVGALARWGLTLALPRTSGHWPWATLVVNLAGCLLLGVLLGALEALRPDDVRVRALLGTGVLGGFTTFSAFAVEVVDLVGAGSVLVAAGYVVASVAGGVLAVGLGLRAGTALAEGAR